MMVRAIALMILVLGCSSVVAQIPNCPASDFTPTADTLCPCRCEGDRPAACRNVDQCLTANGVVKDTAGGQTTNAPGGTTTAGGGAGGTDAPTSDACGTGIDAAQMSQTYDDIYRTIKSNGCPPYDWTGQTTPNDATDQNLEFKIRLQPKIAKTPRVIGLASPLMGAIGISSNGVVFYGNADAKGEDAWINEGHTFNECGGHSGPGGQYHYHAVPNCLWEPLEGAHSPLLGYLADNIPVYGPWDVDGEVPTDLDECGGHTDPGHPFYHYHIQTKYPYIADCLRGCIDGDAIGGLSRQLRNEVFDDCEAADVQYDYSLLSDIPLPWTTAKTWVGDDTTSAPASTSAQDTTASTATSGASSPADTTTTSNGLQITTDTFGNKPNIMYIQVDDMPYFAEWTDGFPAQTDRQERTASYTIDLNLIPNMERIRSEGATFTKAYTVSSMCAPSRYSSFTGRYASRCENAVDSSKNSNSVDATLGTYVSVPNSKMYDGDATDNLIRSLKTADYMTGLVGKWHLGNFRVYDTAEQQVEDTGFDFVGAMYPDNVAVNQTYSHNMEWLTAAALEFMSDAKAANKPFYMALSPTLIHNSAGARDAMAFDDRQTPAGVLPESPQTGTMESRASILSKTDGMEDIDVGMAWLDSGIGAIIDYLEQEEMLDNTVIVIVSDHGQGSKGSLYEQGTRIPFFVRHPATFPAGSTVDTVISTVDNVATWLAIAGVAPEDYPTMDGASWAAAPGQTVASGRLVFAELEQDRAVTDGRFKYMFSVPDVAVKNGVGNNYPAYKEVEQFYDLRTDPAEQDSVFDEALASPASAMGIALSALRSAMVDHIEDTCPEASCALPPSASGVSTGAPGSTNPPGSTTMPATATARNCPALDWTIPEGKDCPCNCVGTLPTVCVDTCSGDEATTPMGVTTGTSNGTPPTRTEPTQPNNLPDGHSPLLGYAFDGFPIFGPNTDGGAPPSDLDTCNGRDHPTLGYVYHMTEQAPYILGCYRGEVLCSSFGRNAPDFCVNSVDGGASVNSLSCDKVNPYLASGFTPEQLAWTVVAANIPSTDGSAYTWATAGNPLGITNSITCSAGSSLAFAANGIPDHDVGLFPMDYRGGTTGKGNGDNPNTIAAQSYSYVVPVNPKKKTAVPASIMVDFDALPMGAIGFALNGVPLFNPYNVNKEDAVDEDSEGYEVMDMCGGHPQMQGGYHYHAIPPCFLAESIARLETVNTGSSPQPSTGSVVTTTMKADMSTTTIPTTDTPRSCPSLDWTPPDGKRCPCNCEGDLPTACVADCSDEVATTTRPPMSTTSPYIATIRMGTTNELATSKMLSTRLPSSTQADLPNTDATTTASTTTSTTLARVEKTFRFRGVTVEALRNVADTLRAVFARRAGVDVSMVTVFFETVTQRRRLLEDAVDVTFVVTGSADVVPDDLDDVTAAQIQQDAREEETSLASLEVAESSTETSASTSSSSNTTIIVAMVCTTAVIVALIAAVYMQRSSRQSPKVGASEDEKKYPSNYRWQENKMIPMDGRYTNDEHQVHDVYLDVSPT